MARRTYEDYQTTTPVVNEYCLMVPLFQNAGSVLSLGLCYTGRQLQVFDQCIAETTVVMPHAILLFIASAPGFALGVLLTMSLKTKGKKIQ
jgi:hypothetical protein